MKHPTLQKIINPGFPLIGLLIVLYLGSWVLNYIYIRDFQAYPAVSIRVFQPNFFWLISGILLITALNILLITQINSKFSIIRIKTFLPAFIYALLITAWKESHFLIYTHLALTAFLISLMLFWGMYKNKKAVTTAFWGSLIISFMGIVNPIYLFLLPISWIGFTLLKCNSTRVYLAALMGILTPWIFYLSFQYFMGNEILIFQTLKTELQPNFLLAEASLYEQIYISITVFILIIGLIGIYTNLYNDSIQTRQNINFLLLFLILLIVLILIFSRQIHALMPMIAFCIAMLLAHPFSLNRIKLYPLLFIIFCIVNAVYMLVNYIKV